MLGSPNFVLLKVKVKLSNPMSFLNFKTRPSEVSFCSESPFKLFKKLNPGTETAVYNKNKAYLSFTLASLQNQLQRLQIINQENEISPKKFFVTKLSYAII